MMMEISGMWRVRLKSIVWIGKEVGMCEWRVVLVLVLVVMGYIVDLLLYEA